MNTSSSTDKGARVIRGLPRSLDRHDPVAIGSDPSSDIVIEGADPHHVELRWDRDEAAWYAFDDPAPGLTLRNGKPIDSTKMFEGDELEIAGVCLRFENGYLKEHRTSAKLKMLLRNVSATAGGKQLLQDISFEARPGMFVALLGPSGCGKSTLIQRIAGLAPFEGQILFNGYDLRTEVASLRPLMAYLPQAVEDTLSGDMTVCEAMDDFVRCHLPSDVMPDFTAKLADVGLDALDIPAKPVRQLSGGQKRRLALALALLREPQLLLLDEPTAGLDPAAEEGVMALLRRIADQGRTVLCATHVLGSLGMCDEVLVLAPGGRQSFVGTPARALNFFGTSDWRDIYRMLQDGTAPAMIPCEISVNSFGDEELAPAQNASASSGRAFCAVLRRLVRAVMLSWKNAAFVFGNPIVIASVLLVACWSMFERGNLGTIYFCMVVAMFWLGLSGAVRNLVAERIPKRCLDRMRGMPLAPYFGAHTAFVFLSVALQAFLFVLPVFLVKLGFGSFSKHALLPFWLILTFVGFSGGCVGLFVSAFAKREIQAVWALPFVAILALFLSKPVLEGGNSEKPVGFLRVVEYAMPTPAPQTLLETTMDRARGCSHEGHAANRCHFVAVSTAYPVVFLTLALLFQGKREKEWDGR